MDGREELSIYDPARMRHFGSRAMPFTSHSSQGFDRKTASSSIWTPMRFSELLNSPAFFAYVSISGARPRTPTFTPMMPPPLPSASATDVSKTSALDFHGKQPLHIPQIQTPKEHAMQHHNELKPEQQSPPLPPEQASATASTLPSKQLFRQKLRAYKWQRETTASTATNILKTHRWLHIDTQGPVL